MYNMSLERSNMVKSQLVPSHITNETLIMALKEIPREIFVPEDKKALAYQDDFLYLSPTRFMLSPLSLAKLIEAAHITSHDHILDIGCGTGYSTAILSFITLSVIGIEEEEDMVDQANENLIKMGSNNAKILKNNLEKGYPEGGPYDIIFIHGSVEETNERILSQLSEEGGRLVTVKHAQHNSYIMTIKRFQNTYSTYYQENLIAPLLSQFSAKKYFQF